MTENLKYKKCRLKRKILKIKIKCLIYRFNYAYKKVIVMIGQENVHNRKYMEKQHSENSHFKDAKYSDKILNSKCSCIMGERKEAGAEQKHLKTY